MGDVGRDHLQSAVMECRVHQFWGWKCASVAHEFACRSQFGTERWKDVERPLPWIPAGVECTLDRPQLPASSACVCSSTPKNLC